MLSRRNALALSLAVPGLAGLAACGPNSTGGSSSSDGAGSVRLAWWGNPTRNTNTSAIVDAYEEANDGATVSAEPGEWSGYWDKLATQTAGGDLPDVIQMDEKYISEYGGRGALADLAELGLDTSDFIEGSVETGELEGTLYAVNAGMNALAILVNPAVFEAAGVEIPDDSTWTWEDYLSISQQVTEASEDGTWGTSQIVGVQGAFQVWIRQQGQDQYADGGAGFDAETATRWLQYGMDLMEAKACPDASTAVEDAAQSLDQSLFATGRIGMLPAWSNQIVAHDEALGGGVQVLRLPSTTGSSADAQLWYKGSMYWSISATSANPEAALAFVNFLVNDPEAGKIDANERGVPANQTVRDAVVPELDEVDAMAAEYLELIADELGEAPEITPQGGGQFEDILTRASEEMMFGTITPGDAGQRVLDDLNAAIQ